MDSSSSRSAWKLPNLDAPFPTVILACLVAIVCYQADRLVFVLGIPPDHIASFWPSTAILVAVMLLVRRRVWPIILAAGLGAMAFADIGNGVPGRFEIWITLGNLSETIAAALGISYLLKGVHHLSNLKSLAKYFVFAGILVPIGSALVGANASGPGGYLLQWRLWFFADSVAFLTVAPAILNWARDGRDWQRRNHNYMEFAAQMALLVFFGYLTFNGTGVGEQPALLYSLVPLLLWAALRLGLKGVSTSMVVVALLSIWGASHGHGPFAAQGPLANALSLQLFLFFAAIPFTVLAVLVEEQQQIQRALIDEDAQLTEAQRLALMGSWQWDPKTDATAWSKGACRIFGYDPALPPPAFREQKQFFTLESWDRLCLHVEVALRSAEPYALDLEGIRVDGTRIWITSRGEAVCNASGQTILLRGTIQDITERKQAEDALRQSQERFRMAAHAGRMFAYEWDAATDAIVRSEEAASILGVNQGAQVTGGQVMAMVFGEDKERLAAAIAKLSPEDPSLQVTYRMRRPDGIVIWVERNSRAYFDQTGRLLRIVGMVADITERKQTEEALSSVSRRLIEAQEQERSRIARELHDHANQRLALLAIGIEELKNDIPNQTEEIRERVNELHKQTVEISNDVHALSHQLHSHKLDYLGLVVAMRAFCKEFSAQRKMQVDFQSGHIPGPVPPDISLCLFRVMQEALHNAAKHSGAKILEVRLRGTPEEIELTVSDSGAGFDLEAARNGPGLGLVSIQERAQLVNGTLSIESQPGHGTTIHACVPLNRKAQAMRSAR